jgi:hypothetical protein
MPNLIKQGEARVITKNGEVFVNISLELNIKLEGVSTQGLPPVAGSVSALAKEEKVNWEIPDFSPGKIDFGK